MCFASMELTVGICAVKHTDAWDEKNGVTLSRHPASRTQAKLLPIDHGLGGAGTLTFAST
jgi:hypothetical protein